MRTLAEEALMMYIAGQLGLNVPAEIAHVLSAETPARAVILGEYLGEYGDQVVAVERYMGIVRGRFLSRADALSFSDSVSDLFPVYGVIQGTIKFPSITRAQGSSEPVRDFQNNTEVWYTVVYLTVCASKPK